MKLALVGDVHLADHPPSIRTEDYVDHVMAKLEFVVTDATARGCEALVQLGDLLHVKAPSRTSHRLVQATVDVLSAFPGPVLVVPGNHDMQHDRIESLSHQPLGAICKATGIDMLIGPHPELPIFGLPYLYDWQVLLPVWMKRYRAWAERHPHPLLATHAPIFPDGEEPPYDYLLASEWAALQQVGDCAYGHIHDPHGYYEAGGIWFSNQGALSRGSLHERTLSRRPAYAIWER